MILITGLVCDATPLGDEGARFLVLNKNKLDEQQTGDFSYNLTTRSFSPSYDVINHQWDQTSDVYDINVQMNQILNLTEIDQFLTKYHCGSGERLGSMSWGSPSQTVNINCLTKS